MQVNHLESGMHEHLYIHAHEDPVWRERANYIFQARIEAADSTDSDSSRSEQLWGRKIDEGRIEVCCIPFLVYGIALGDVIEIDESNEFERVVQRSGRSVFRVWLGGSENPPRDDVVAQLEAMGALLEWASPNLLAIDAADEDRAVSISAALLERQARDELLYEVGSS